MSVDVVESGPLEAHLPVELAGSQPGRVHEALARANAVAAADATDLLAAWLPDLPADDRRRVGMEPVRGRAGAVLAERVTAAHVLDLLDTADLRAGGLHLHRRGAAAGRGAVLDVIGRATDRPTARRTVDGTRVADALATGATLQVAALDLVLPDLARLAEAAERTTGGHVSVRAFVAGGLDGGIGRHPDPVETWVVQVEGTKDWTLWAPSIPAYDEARPAPGLTAAGPPEQMRLGPGDTLVVPRGHLHDVVPGPGLSVALGVVVGAPSRARLLELALAGVGAEPQWLEPVHAGGSAPTTAPGIDAPDGADLLGALGRWRASRPGRHVGGAAAVLRATLAGDPGRLTLRSPLGGGLHVVDDRPWADTFTVAGGGRALRLTRRSLDVVATMAEGRPRTVDDLSWPGSAADLEALLGALVREGIVGPV